ncbi:MAG: hypothetical protein ACLPW4_01815 [Candidatus Sulfotelmatobacter sp.]
MTATSHSITATYNGNSSFSTSTSSALTQTVNQDSTTSSVEPRPEGHSRPRLWLTRRTQRSPPARSPLWTAPRRWHRGP